VCIYVYTDMLIISNEVSNDESNVCVHMMRVSIYTYDARIYIYIRCVECMCAHVYI